jgi:hypothetical protein
MGPDDFDDAFERAENILKRENPLARKETNTYAGVMRSVYAKVGRLRAKGFSFTQICAACEKSGLLKDANPYCFRQAFRRERARRLTDEELAKFMSEARDEKQASPANGTDSPQIIGPGSANPGSEEDEENDRIKKLTSTTVDTGLGIITKNTDGSFDY